jgi:hypothetical protein
MKMFKRPRLPDGRSARRLPFHSWTALRVGTGSSGVRDVFRLVTWESGDVKRPWEATPA